MRTPSSASLEYARDKVEKAAELARADARDQEHRQQRQRRRRPRLVDIGKSERAQSLGGGNRGSDLREKLKQLVGAEYVVLDDLNNGAQKPVQIHFYGADSRKLMEITNDFMEKLRKVTGAVDVGLSEKEPKDELRIELDRGLANQLGISVGDAAQTLRVAFAGVEVGDWVDPIGESRDVSVRLHPDDRVDASNIEHLPVPVAGTNMMVPLEQIAKITMDKGPAQIQHLNGKRTVTVSANVDRPRRRRSHGGRDEDREGHRVPAGFGIELGGASRDQAGALHRDVHRADHGHRRDVPRAGDAVRLVHRAAAGHDVAAAVADRRGAGAADHARHAQSHELSSA